VKNRLERVPTNLVENALRPSPRGSTGTIGVREEQGGVLTTTVDDEGPGVSPELTEHLFQKLEQGSHKTERISLGLYFCHITVERWGERSATRHEQATGRDLGYASPAP
jgi:K+-sensing histidine kinase KdpD